MPDSINTDPASDYEALKKQAADAADVQDFDRALELYQQALALVPESADAWIDLGNAFTNTSQVDKAAECYHKAIELDPNNWRPYNNLGLQAQKACNFDEAIQLYQQALSCKPDSTVILNNLGNAYSDSGQDDKAFQVFQKSLILCPDQFDAPYNLAVSYKDQAHWAKTIEMLEHQIKFVPFEHIGDYCWVLVRACHAIKDFNSCVYLYKKLVEIYPDNEMARSCLGYAYLYTDQFDEAIFWYKTILDQQPQGFTDNEVWVHFILAHMYSRKYDEAITQTKNALALHPEMHKLLSMQAWIYNQLDKLEEALISIRAALQVSPADNIDPGYWAYEAFLLFKLDRWEEGINSLNLAFKNIETKSEFLFDISLLKCADLLQEHGDLELAECCRKKAAEIEVDD